MFDDELFEARITAKFDQVMAAIRSVDEHLARESASIREEMRRSFAETQELIRASLTDLDRRKLDRPS